MSVLTTEKHNQPFELTPEKRASYLFETLLESGQLWILTDEHGCVMLNSDDEDCVPVWPNKECAEMWLTEEWKACKAISLSAKEWQQKWLVGLEQDELAIAVFPDLEGEGLVLFPDEFASELNRIKGKK